ncbi:MAG: thioesterase family protein [Vicingaceae bacterium]
MYTYEVKIRVRYAETDKMGYLYYGNYATYFEVARVESLRNLGIVYKELEDRGILLPVLNYQTKFIKPAFYDEELTIKTMIPEIPGARIHFDYEVYNAQNELINVASTTLVFLNQKTGKPSVIPDDVLEKLLPYYN